MPQIDVHPSITNVSFEKEVEASLHANELSAKLLYVTPRQTELWRQVFLKHSPVHGNPEFARIYREAFARVAGEHQPEKVWLVGIGCGTGAKEAQFCSSLMEAGHDADFSAIDASHDLVAESAQKLSDAGAESGRHLVCDMSEIDFIKEWLSRIDTDRRRVFTFFGLVPNLMPMVVIQLLHEILRPGDVVLVNAHLAPLDENIDPEKSANLQMDHLKPAMEKVLPQYDNPETHAWLNAAVDQWKLGEFVEEVRIGWGLMRRLPVIYGAAHWRSLDLYRRWCSKPSWADPSLRLFRSLRYTPELFENMLNDAGLSAKLLAITACREEAIWVVRKK